jgi:hypothetical protein
MVETTAAPSIALLVRKLARDEVRLIEGGEQNNGKAGRAYIPTLGPQSAPKMGHPVISGWLRRTGNGRDEMTFCCGRGSDSIGCCSSNDSLAGNCLALLCVTMAEFESTVCHARFL